MSKKRKRTSKNRRKLNFERLEEKRLLAVGDYDITPTSIVINNNDDLAAETNLIVNGDFSDATDGNGAGFFNQNNVAGWSIVGHDETNGARINIFNITSLDYGNVVDLDSTNSHFDQLFQDVVTESGTEYLLSFEMHARQVNDGASENTNSLEVFWDGDSIGTFDAGFGWQTVQIVVEGDDLQTRLEFREVADTTETAGDGRGPLLDNVRLTKIINDDAIGNGSFESFTGAAGDLANGNVDNWAAIAETETDRMLHIVEDSTASLGGHYLELDTSAGLIDRAFQDIATEADGEYFLMFDMRSGDGTDAKDNELRVRFDNNWVGTFQGTEDWAQHSIYVTATTDLTRVVFREAFSPGETDFGTGEGPQIDNIRIFKVGAVLNLDLDTTESGINATANFTEDDGERLILDNDLSIAGSESTTITNATVQVTNLLDAGLEFLDVNTAGTNITPSYNASTGELTLTGDDSAANYETVLRSLSYNNFSQIPDTTVRQIAVTITSGDTDSQTATISVNITAVNDDPIIRSITDSVATTGNEFTATAFGEDADDETITYTLTATGTAVAGTAAQPTIDEDGQISWTPDTNGEADITVTVEDPTGAQATTTFNVQVVTQFANDGSIANLAPALRNNLYTAAPAMNIDLANDYTAVITMEDGGVMEFVLFDNDAPETVNSFVNLARDGYFDGLSFHRVVDTIQARVAQGGDPTGTGTGGPGYTIPLEVSNTDLRFDDIGVLGMARANDPNSGGSQFFITLADQDVFSGDFTVFGDLTSGQSVLENITPRDPNTATTPGDIMASVRIVES